MDTGAVLAGVIGTTKFAYDIWGPAVNTASQMECMGLPSCIQVTEAIRAKISPQFLFEERGEFYVKGVGDVRTYFLRGKKTSP